LAGRAERVTSIAAPMLRGPLATGPTGLSGLLCVAAATFLAVGMPTFDLIPSSCHRALGFLALLILGRPRRRRPS